MKRMRLMNKAPSWLGPVVPGALFICLLVNVSVPAQDVPQTPEPNSPERKAIMNALRAPVEKELKQKVIFRIRHLKMQNGWAFLEGVPQQPGGTPVDYTITPHRTAFEAGAFDDSILALLRKKAGAWRVVVYDIGSTDYSGDYWQQKYEAPPEIFPHKVSERGSTTDQ